MSSAEGGRDSGGDNRGDTERDQIHATRRKFATIPQPRPANLDNIDLDPEYRRPQASSDGAVEVKAEWTDQGHDLPDWDKGTTINWPGIDKLKGDGTNTVQWSRSLLTRCEEYRCAQLLQDLPPPSGKGKARDNWMEWTHQVSIWMQRMMERPAIDRIIRGQGSVPQESDNLLRAINRFVQPKSKMSDIMRDWGNYVSMKRSDYSSIDKYIDAVADQINRLRNRDVCPLPAVCFAGIFNELKDEIPGMSLAQLGMESPNLMRNPTTMTWEQFRSQCRKIREMAKQVTPTKTNVSDAGQHNQLHPEKKRCLPTNRVGEKN